jgi:hypothetical protein
MSKKELWIVIAIGVALIWFLPKRATNANYPNG